MKIPREVEQISHILTTNGHKAYLVGGCVRDLLSESPPADGPKDWDLATDARPEEIQSLFPESIYENNFGTVGVKTESSDPALKIIEVTTFRKEGRYTNKRHPDEITFTKSIEEDLSRRDFTINAIAIDMNDTSPDGEDIIDPYSGQEDLKKGLIKAVGRADERFAEDALRLMRAVRLSAQLGFDIDLKTEKAIRDSAPLLARIAPERIRDEFEKLIMAKGAVEGVRKMEYLGLLKEVMPELSQGVGIEQNKHHIYDVFEHNLRSLEYAVEKNFSLELRLASLMHDIGKPGTRKWQNDPRGEKEEGGKKGDWTFYQHQYLGEKLTRNILGRLRFSSDVARKVALLVREHMFVYDPEIVTEKGVRRLLRRVGGENIGDLIKLREADRIGSGVPKAQPYRLRHLQAMIEKAKTEPISVGQLKIDGNIMISELDIQPGPKMGHILAILLEEVIDDPSKNMEEYLKKRAMGLSRLPEDKLNDMAHRARESASEAQRRIDDAIKEKYFVR